MIGLRWLGTWLWNSFICFWLKTPIWVSCPLEWDNACLEIILFMDPACEEWVELKAGIMDQTGSFCNVEIVLAIRFTLFTNQYKHSWWGKRKLSLSVETFKQFMNKNEKMFQYLVLVKFIKQDFLKFYKFDSIYLFCHKYKKTQKLYKYFDEGWLSLEDEIAELCLNKKLSKHQPGVCHSFILWRRRVEWVSRVSLTDPSRRPWIWQD